jgi:hypothetical protein
MRVAKTMGARMRWSQWLERPVISSAMSLA